MMKNSTKKRSRHAAALCRLSSEHTQIVRPLRRINVKHIHCSLRRKRKLLHQMSNALQHRLLCSRSAPFGKPLGKPLGKPRSMRVPHPADVVPQSLFALLILPALNFTLHKNMFRLNCLVDCCLTHGEFLRFLFA